MDNIRFIELFAGIGGFRYGLESVQSYVLSHKGEYKAENTNGRNRLDVGYNREQVGYFECVYANEWDKYAAEIYERNYGELPDTRDIRDVEATSIPDHEILTAGFPCQAFSVAGKRKGFEDTRGTLFFEIARIAKQKQSPILLLENVKGLLSHDKGRTFGIILETLDELGYDLQWQVLNSKDFGVPQNRERVFIVGNLRGTTRPEVFPIVTTNGKNIEQINNPVHSNNRIYDGDGVSPSLNTMQGGRRQPKIFNRKDGLKRDIDTALALNSSNWRGINRNQNQTSVVEEQSIRRLTPVECERLQGFPDGWTEGSSDTQRYKCLGNAVTTNVITAIGLLLLRSIR